MGLSALRYESSTVAAPRPRLRVVKPAARPGKVRRAKISHAGAYQAFVFFAVVVGVAALLGVGRVWLSVQAAQASIDAARIQREIKVERYVGDLLEVQQSALAAPSRIQTLAGSTMGMAPATSVTFIRLTVPAKPGGEPAGTDAKTLAEPSNGVLDRAMNIAAGEARMLLVGDLALATAR